MPNYGVSNTEYINESTNDVKGNDYTYLGSKDVVYNNDSYDVDYNDNNVGGLVSNTYNAEIIQAVSGNKERDVWLKEALNIIAQNTANKNERDININFTGDIKVDENYEDTLSKLVGGLINAIDKGSIEHVDTSIMFV